MTYLEIPTRKVTFIPQDKVEKFSSDEANIEFEIGENKMKKINVPHGMLKAA